MGGLMAEPVRARRLSDEEGRRLQQIVRRGKHGPVRVRQAMIIMASASGTPVGAIARLVAADEDTVRDVVHAFSQKGLAALDPQWAGGRPRLISDEDVKVIVTAATTGPEKLGLPFTHRSVRKLAAYLERPANDAFGAAEACRDKGEARDLMIIGLPQSMIFGVSRACCAIMPAGTGLGRVLRVAERAPRRGSRRSPPRGTHGAATAAVSRTGWSLSM
jgi:transposase